MFVKNSVGRPEVDVQECISAGNIELFIIHPCPFCIGDNDPALGTGSTIVVIGNREASVIRTGEDEQFITNGRINHQIAGLIGTTETGTECFVDGYSIGTHLFYIHRAGIAAVGNRITVVEPGSTERTTRGSTRVRSDRGGLSEIDGRFGEVIDDRRGRGG